MEGWEPMATAPKDANEIVILLPIVEAKAYWDHDLQTWVLSMPVSIETVGQPIGWRRAT